MMQSLRDRDFILLLIAAFLSLVLIYLAVREEERQLERTSEDVLADLRARYGAGMCDTDGPDVTITPNYAAGWRRLIESRGRAGAVVKATAFLGS